MKGSAVALADKRQPDIEETAPASGGRRRGACPTLAAPMPTGDGLLVRLRPAGGALRPAELKALATSAAANGNGLLEITARGNLQVRGLTPAGVDRLASDIDKTGIVVPPGPAIELSPLHGIDPDELGDAAGFETMLRERLDAKFASPSLAPKLSIVLDGRGRFGLDHLAADIRAVAMGDGRWLVSVDADTRRTWPIHAGSTDSAIAAIGILIDLLIAGGRHCRMREIPPAVIEAAFPSAGDLHSPQNIYEKPRPGIFTLSGGKTVLGLRPRFGQMTAAAALGFIAEAEARGASEIRLAPDRQFFVAGLRDRDAEALRSAQQYGLSADPRDPAASIAACAGAGACGSGFYPTRALAERMLDRAPDLFDGSLDIHLSGCGKGCARPRPALVITGVKDGYGLVLDGRADEPPDVTIAGGRIDFAIEKLAQLAGTQRQAGESVAGCLRRLGSATIAEALRQE